MSIIKQPALPGPAAIAPPLPLVVRKVVQIQSVCYDGSGSTELTALCDDGSVWRQVRGGWLRMDVTTLERAP